jgi:hypothetical protein
VERPPGYDDERHQYHRSHQHIDIDYERQRTAATRDYTTPAVITLILYFVCWLPGVIANIIYFLQARQDEALVGREPQGKGCLLWLLIVMNGLIVVGVGLYCVLIFLGMATASV